MADPEDAKSTQNATILAKTATAPQRMKFRLPFGLYNDSQKNAFPR